MNKKTKNALAVALASLALTLGSCGGDGGSSASSSAGTSEDTSSDVSSEPVEATAISLSFGKSTIGVGETLEAVIALEPTDAAAVVALSSSNPDYISVDGVSITGVKLTDETVPSVTITAATDNGLTASVELTVVSLYESVVTNDLAVALEKSLALEEASVNGVAYSEKEYVADGTTLNGSVEYASAPYVTTHNETIETVNDGTSETVYRIVDGEEDGNYVHLTQLKDGDSYVATSFSGANAVKTIKEDNDASLSSEINREDADLAYATAALDAPNGVTFYGLSNLIEGYFLGNAEFLAESAITDLAASHDGNAYTISGSAIQGSTAYERALTVTFGDDGALASFSATEKSYAYDSETGTVGAQTGSVVYEGSNSYGDRKADDGAFDLQDRFYSSFDVVIASSSSATESDATINVGTTYYVNIVNALPSTAVPSMESVTITCSASDATISNASQWIQFASAGTDVTITVATTRASKTITVSPQEPVATSINIDALASEITLATAQAGVDFVVAKEPSNAALSLSATLENNTCGATVEANVSAEDTLTFKATQAGSVTVTVTDANSGLAASKDVAVSAALSTTAADIVTRLTTSTLTISGNSDVDTFTMTSDGDGATTGTFQAMIYNMSGNLTTTDGTFSVVANGDNFDLTLTASSTGRARVTTQTISLTADFTSFVVECTDGFGDASNFTITLS